MTKEEIGSILKGLRIACGMTQKEVAERLGRNQPIVGHWETGYAQPDANTLFTLCDIYGVNIDEAFGFQKNDNISKEEYEHIKKYRSLDPHGKKMVDFTLNEEWERSTAGEKVIPMAVKQDAEFSAKLVPDEDYLKPQAAHNDNEREEQVALMQEDMSALKRPE